MSDDTQAMWDAETAAQTRKVLKRLAGKLRQARANESASKQKERESRKASRQAHEQLALFLELDNDGSDLEYVRHLQSLSEAVRAARKEESAARQRWTGAMVARRKAQDELLAATLRHTTPLPLFDRLPKSS